MKNVIYISVFVLLLITINYFFENGKNQEVETLIEFREQIDVIEEIEIDQPIQVELGGVEVNEYHVNLAGKQSSAALKIQTIGELQNVSGSIHYREKEITNTVKKTIPESGLFLYAATSLNQPLARVEIGLDYQFKNKIVVGTSISHNAITNQTFVNGKLGYRIW